MTTILRQAPTCDGYDVQRLIADEHDDAATQPPNKLTSDKATLGIRPRLVVDYTDPKATDDPHQRLL